MSPRSRRKSARAFHCLIAALLLGGCGSASSPATDPTLSARAALGKALFNDTSLSASGQQSCATCHVASRAYASDDDRAVPLGGPDMRLPGLRNAPSLKYLSFTPAFHFEADGTPVGGFFRDGRATSFEEQSQGPFINPFEMANADATEVLARLRASPHFAQFTQVFGTAVLSDPPTVLARIAQAIAAYEREDEDFRPFDSKYDAWVRGAAQLSAAELDGLRLYNDPQKGNCAACHIDTPSANGTPALFTDFTYDNLGVPRNNDIPANDDSVTLAYVPYNGDDVHRYYDLGLCGPLRSDVSNHLDTCGAFKVPTLRNIALTAPYFHNGRFATLTETLGFYVRRDTNPAEWYPTVNGAIVKFDDLPASFRGNVNVTEVPYNRNPGDAPALSPTEIQHVIAFLCTLTDGYDPQHPAAYNASSAECAAASSSTP